MATGLTPSQLSSFERDGYLTIPNALTPQTVSSLLSETHKLLREFPLQDHPLTRFSTGQKAEHVGDDYFLSSGDKIRFFFEEDAFDEAGNLTKPKERAVNKIGHCLHALSPPFARLVDEAETGAAGEVSPAAVARSLGFRDARCLQSMVICKQPEIGGAVPPTRTLPSCTPTPLRRGVLVRPRGRHAGERLPELPAGLAPLGPRGEPSGAQGGQPRHRDDPQPGAEVPPGERYGAGGEEAKEGGGEYVPGEVKAGDLVLIHGNLLHKSERNTSQKGRIIYTFHIIEAEDREYDERNWLQPPKEGFTKLYV
ncbi:Phytanoyl-CoA dioxygenase domain-containing protein 1 [Cladobotryum mycophilum]|uniref:Phytanoyl-CoA dioxygenase domain-containing protein 1 n=1 Tax=Cladobotryum mycophilum TaxID=491253 RepID=A0ABR0S5V5_9HYPO